jgi:hypothetical protein
VSVDVPAGVALLSAMITPAVLVSAAGLLIISTSARLARVMDRVRLLAAVLESLAGSEDAAAARRRGEAERQIGLQAQRGRLIQQALTCLYLAVATFVATILGIGLVAVAGRPVWLPGALGVAGTLFLFAGCVLLIRETRLALRAVQWETSFVLSRPSPR